jgi:hypothetical protein
MSETLTRAEAPSLVEPPTGHIDDFNFFIGDWKTRHHQLVGRLVGSTTWRDFGGVSQVRKIMGGQGNLDDNILDLPTGAYRAATVRTFDPASRHWSIYWIDAVSSASSRRWSAASTGRTDCSSPRRCRREGRWWYASAGQCSTPTTAAGSRPSPRIAA